ncbi:MAG: helix-turn-helix transcriptional regulator [Sphingorhabdus sp.]
MITAKQSRMARVALDWTTTDLALQAGVGRATVARFELGQPVADESVAKIRNAMEASGVAFSSTHDRVTVTAPA